MYADYSSDQVRAFLEELTEQPRSEEVDTVAEKFSDDMMLAAMELARFKKSVAEGTSFEPRAEKIMRMTRIHPADMH